MPKPSRIPLTLFQVLEEEFEALHNEPVHNGVVKLPDAERLTEYRDVNLTSSWRFDKTHIRNAAALFIELSPASVPASPAAKSSGLYELVSELTKPAPLSDPDKLAKERLKQYLQSKLHHKDKPDAQSPYDQFVTPDSGEMDELVRILNHFLDDQNLFDEERFSNYWLNSPAQAMRDIHVAGPPLTGDDLRHFNRLLLEAAFPRFLEPIYRIRLAAAYDRLHKKPTYALSLSGGGIRSGTFALGLLQGLARHQLLDEFHYLSTVSGGGYIGSWLAAWIHRHRNGLPGVTAELANTIPRTKIDPDPRPLRYLRRYSNFITPRVGLLSADTWTFISIYVRNLFLNWLIFIPAILLALLLPRLVVAITTISGDGGTRTLGPLGSLDLFTRRSLLVVGSILIAWALTYVIFNRPTVREELREASPFWRRQTTQRGFLKWCLLPLTAGAFCVTTYWGRSSQGDALPKVWWHFLLFGLLTTAVAWIVSSLILRRFRFRSIEFILLPLVGAGGAMLLFASTIIDPFGSAEPWRPWIYGHYWNWSAWTIELYASFAAPGFLLVFLTGVALYVGVTSKSGWVTVDDEDREWWARLSAWVLIVVLAWIAFSTLVIFGPILLLKAPGWFASAGGIAGILAALAGRSTRTPATSKSAESGSAKGGIMSAILGKLLPLLALVFLSIVAMALSLVTSGILATIIYAIRSLPAPMGIDFYERAQVYHMNVVHLTPVWLVVGLAVVLFVVAWALSRFINLNIFSLHAGYRNRLIRAFLGASRPDNQRKPNPFTGFDPADNVSMHELRPGLFTEADFPDATALADQLLKRSSPVAQYLSDHGFLTNLGNIENPESYSLKLVAALRKDLNAALQDPALTEDLGKQAVPTHNYIFINRQILQNAFPDLINPPAEDSKYRLMPVINTTLNLVGGDNLAWQQRRAEPFSVSPLHSGCFRLGYRDSRFYGGQNTGGISVGTAATVSGAAASSNMGYYTTSPVLSLVLTFLNVRLGWWLGNPGAAGKESFVEPAPKSSVIPVLDEALGLTDDKNEYIYLTDGGHFENLGLYEMVLRRCRVIVVSDAAADKSYEFGDLGNAIRKVRIDLGVPIEFTAMPIFGCDPDDPPEGKQGMYWAVGRIRYGCIDGPGVKDGLLIYIKPAVYGKEPRDVLEYKKSHASFPHQTTADQFFDEPQFESYRVLGSHIMDQLCGSDNDPLTIDKMVEKAVTKLSEVRGNVAADPELKQWFDECFCKPKSSE